MVVKNAKTFEDKINELKERKSQIDGRIKDYQDDRERIRNLELYHKTKEGISEILGGDMVYQYAERNNDEELKEKLEKRTLTIEEYLEVLEKCIDEKRLSTQEFLDIIARDFPEYLKGKREEVMKMYEKMFSLLENGNKTQRKKRVKIGKPKETLSKLNIGYQIVNGVILPTKGNNQTIKKGRSVLQESEESEQEYVDKINLLFSKVLIPENGFGLEDYNVIAGEEPKKMVRKTTYIIVEIPEKNKMVILNNGYGEASFLCDEIIDKNILTGLSKEELIKKYGKNIEKLEFQDEQVWSDKILEWLGKNGEIEKEKNMGLSGNTEKQGAEKSGVEETGTEGTGAKETSEVIYDINDVSSDIPEYPGPEGPKVGGYLKKIKGFLNRLSDDVVDEMVCKLWDKKRYSFVASHVFNLSSIDKLEKKEVDIWAKVKKEYDSWLNVKANASFLQDELSKLMKKPNWKIKSYEEKNLVVKVCMFRIFMDAYFKEKTGKFTESRKIFSKLEKDYQDFCIVEPGDDKEKVEKIVFERVIVALQNSVKRYMEGLNPVDFGNDKNRFNSIGTFLGVYEDCLNETDIMERDMKLINFVNEMFGKGLIEEGIAKNIFKSLYLKAILDDDNLDEEFKKGLYERIENNKTSKIIVENGKMNFYLKLTSDINEPECLKELYKLGFFFVRNDKWLKFIKLKSLEQGGRVKKTLKK